MSGPPPVGGDDQSDSDPAAAGDPSRGRRLAGWLRTRVENVARIARWEVTKNAGGVDRRTVVIAVLAILGLGAMAPVAVSQGVALDKGIYRVGVVQEDPLYDPVYLDPTFRVQNPSSSAVEAGYQEIMVVGPQVREYANSTKGRAAVAELRSTVKRYNDGIMDLEENRSAAFPVLVNLTYVDRESTRVSVTRGQTIPIETDEEGGDGGGGSDGGGDGGDGGDGSASGDGGEGSASGDSSDGTASSDGSDGSAGDGSADVTRPDEGSNVAGSSIGARLTGGSSTGTPSDITPPFPFRSLVLAFVFVLPLNFVIQAYGSTILSERINRRGELLLVAPVSRGDIIVGKTLPYFAAAVGVAAGITVVLQVGLGLAGSVVSVLAIVPLALLFLAATFLGAMFARSFKELTFVTVTITVTLTSYAFVPAIFTDVTPIALISPLTLVVRDLQGQAIGLGQFVFSTLPPTLTALVCFGLGAGLYREEDMFTQRPIPYKVLDALAGVEPLTDPRDVSVRDRCLATTDGETYATAREAIPELPVEVVDDARGLADLARGYSTVIALDETFAGVEVEGDVRVEPNALSNPVEVVPERALSFFATNRDRIRAAIAVHRAADLDAPCDLDALEDALSGLTGDGGIAGDAEVDRLATALDDLDAAVGMAENVANDRLREAIEERDVTIEGADLLSLVERGAGVDSLLSRELADEYDAAVAKARDHLVDALQLTDTEAVARRVIPDDPTYPVERNEEAVSRLREELTAARDAARQLTGLYNDTGPHEEDRRRLLLEELLGSGGETAWIEPPLHCDYGWNVHEGTHCFDPSAPREEPAGCPSHTLAGQQLRDPVIEYPHPGVESEATATGVAVVGGYRYRGPIDEFDGRYIFADWQAEGRLFVAAPTDDGLWPVSTVPVRGESFGRFVRAFGRDSAGRLYALTSEQGGTTGSSGALHRLTA